MSRRRTIALRVVVGVFLVVAAAGATAPAVASDSPEDGTPLSVTITDGSTPTPSASPSRSTPGGAGTGGGQVGGSNGGSRPGGSGSGGAGAGAVSGGGSTTPQTTPTGEVSVAGMLYVGGLNGNTFPSLNPTDGTVDLWFTVRNASTSVVDASAQFWIDGAVFSNRLDTASEVPIAGLQPGETRVVSASLHGAGQWTLVSGHVTLTPPDTVDGTALTPVTRDGLFLVFPWLLLSLLVVAVVAWVIVRVVRDALPPVPEAVTT
ncbi:hypothetical protein [Microbacterium sp. B19]|uniref:hypothetical protein n=1 Tax=Microbacterium sp. B19 TaxID=96765 RepID=UPI00034765E0|nr:hypothetical protein [Microbacterium sp. B19]